MSQNWCPTSIQSRAITRNNSVRIHVLYFFFIDKVITFFHNGPHAFQHPHTRLSSVSAEMLRQARWTLLTGVASDVARSILSTLSWTIAQMFSIATRLDLGRCPTWLPSTKRQGSWWYRWILAPMHCGQNRHSSATRHVCFILRPPFAQSWSCSTCINSRWVREERGAVDVILVQKLYVWAVCI